jgi:hypothetical protein
MDIVAVWLIDIVLLHFFYMIMVCTIMSDAFCNSKYLFILFIIGRPGMALSVYRTTHVCGNVRMYSSCFVLELVGVSVASQNGDESVSMKVDDHTFDVGITADCVQPPQPLRFIPRGSSPVPLGTSKIRSPPGPRLIQHSINNVIFTVENAGVCLGHNCLDHPKIRITDGPLDLQAKLKQ